jgi:hypothetical protein
MPLSQSFVVNGCIQKEGQFNTIQNKNKSSRLFFYGVLLLIAAYLTSHLRQVPFEVQKIRSLSFFAVKENIP